jgi:hypothetical protein
MRGDIIKSLMIRSNPDNVFWPIRDIHDTAVGSLTSYGFFTDIFLALR